MRVSLRASADAEASAAAADLPWRSPRTPPAAPPRTRPPTAPAAMPPMRPRRESRRESPARRVVPVSWTTAPDGRTLPVPCAPSAGLFVPGIRLLLVFSDCARPGRAGADGFGAHSSRRTGTVMVLPVRRPLDAGRDAAPERPGPGVGGASDRCGRAHWRTAIGAQQPTTGAWIRRAAGRQMVRCAMYCSSGRKDRRAGKSATIRRRSGGAGRLRPSSRAMVGTGRTSGNTPPDPGAPVRRRWSGSRRPRAAPHRAGRASGRGAVVLGIGRGGAGPRGRGGGGPARSHCGPPTGLTRRGPTRNN